MNVTSLELSKELYELSGWGGTNYSWASVKDKTTMYKPMLRATIGSNSAWHEDPAYDLGYLLRELPLVELKHVAISSDDPYFWTCTTSMQVQRWLYPLEVREMTPEDAAARLAIELFKQGILKRDDS